MSTVKIKICGITSMDDALAAADAGADALGFNFYEGSPRFIDPAKAREIIGRLPPFLTIAGVFVNAKRASIEQAAISAGLNCIQLHGDERPRDCEGFAFKVIKALRAGEETGIMQSFEAADAILVDAPHHGEYGGTGKRYDWALIEKFKSAGKPVIISGGLGPDNVREAILTSRPYAVDACSRLETERGIKDHRLMRKFIEIAKEVII